MNKILIVDDQKIFLDTFELAIESEFENVTVYLAMDGKEAWTIFQNSPVDLVITDHAMPNWSGIKLTEAIREQNKTLPVILMTGRVDDFDESQFTDVILKPFKLKKFIETVKKHLPHQI